MVGVEPSRWRLGDVLFDQVDGAVWRDGLRHDLTPKLLDILTVLVAAAPRAVTKEQLLDAVWPESVVGEAALAQRVKELRRLLGDDARQPRYIQTVARRGYRLKVAAERVPDGESGDPPATAGAVAADRAPVPAGGAPLLRWLAGLLSVVIVTLGWVVVKDRLRPSLPQAPPASVVPSPFTPRRAVAVAVAPREGSDAGGAWAGPVIAELLTAELGAGGALRTINSARLAEVARDLGYDGLPQRAALPRLRQLVGVDLAVVGRYRVKRTDGEDVLELWLEVRDAANGSTIGAVAESAPLLALNDMAVRLGSKLLSTCGVAVPAAPDLLPLRAVFPTGPIAARSYGEGLAALRAFDFPRAILALEEALRAEGGAVAARLALAQALEWSGQRERALGELDRCLRQAGLLPRELQLVIEADYRELNGQWERAVEINRSLHVLYPDNVDYGLSLATLLASHGDETSAKRTLDELGRLPAPLGLDPRIELARAWMHETDLTAKFAAAGRAAERANTLGARLLLAAARIQQGRALRGLGKPAEAVAAFEEAWRLREQAGDASGVGKALRHVALVERDGGELPAAEAHLETATDIFRRLGDPEQLAETLRERASLAMDRGQLGEAAGLLAEAGDISRGGRRGGAEALLALERARLARLAESPSRAVDVARSAVAACRTDALTVAEARARAGLGLAMLAAGEAEAAHEEVRAAQDLAAETDDRAVRLEVATAAATVAAALGDCREVREGLEHALTEGLNAPLRLRLEAEMALARCSLTAGDLGGRQRLAALDALARGRGFQPSTVREPGIP